jgi:hypothetical protein
LGVSRLLDLPGGGPTTLPVALFTGGGLRYVGLKISMFPGAVLFTAGFLSLLLIMRLILRRTDLAWTSSALLFVALGVLGSLGTRPASMSVLVLLAVPAVFALMMVWLMWKHGALAWVTGYTVGVLVDQVPWTLDFSRWYAWRGFFSAAIVVALTVWGFRNVLGKQTAFPTGALDG